MHRRSAIFAATFLWPCSVYATDVVAPAGGAMLLFRMVLVLGGVCLLAFVSLKWGLKRFVHPTGSAPRAMRVLGRLAVEPRRSVIVVRIADRVLILGSSETGLESLGEMSPAEAEVLEVAPTSKPRFHDILTRSAAEDVSRETIGQESA